MTEGVDDGQLDGALPGPVIPGELGDSEIWGKADRDSDPVGCIDKLGPCEGRY